MFVTIEEKFWLDNYSRVMLCEGQNLQEGFLKALPMNS
jgi:hypothetical protein